MAGREQVPATHHLAFVTPMRAGLGVTLLLAVVALAIMVGPRGFLVPGATTSPIASVLATPSALPTSAATQASAVPTPTPTPTPMPTDTPTPATTWSGIDWSEGVVSFPYRPPVYQGWSGTSTEIDAIVRWRDGYVGVGSYTTNDHPFMQFFSSMDGLHWAERGRIALGPESINNQPVSTWANPAMVFILDNDELWAYGSGLQVIGPEGEEGTYARGAFGPWRSADGATWVAASCPSWQDAVAGPTVGTRTGAFVRAASSGPAGIVAIGADMEGAPRVVRSRDGCSWEQVQLPGSPDRTTFLSDVEEIPGGYVIVGATAGRPAAWSSVDGVTWSLANVEGVTAAGGQLLKLVVGGQGLLAIGADSAHARDLTAWTSADGNVWHPAGTFVERYARYPVFASDGEHMIMFGTEDTNVSCPLAGTLRGWVSTDGIEWSQLALGGAAGVAPECQWGDASGPDGDSLVLTADDSAAWVVEGGVIVASQHWEGGRLLGQEIWFGTAAP